MPSPYAYIKALIVSLQLFSFMSCLISPTALFAQESDFRFKHLTIDDGLSSSKVNCIYQDSKGFMWFGTFEGLNRYDGYEFTIFQKDNEKPGQISGNFIRCIFEDSKGNLWIGTETGGVNLFNRATNTFVYFKNDSTSRIRISSNNIKSILEDRQGNLWLGTANGLDLFDLENNKATNYLPDSSGTFPSKSNIINALLEDSRNNFWLGTGGGGLYLFDRETKTFECFRNDPLDKYSLSDNDIRSLFEDAQGNLWVGTYNGGLNLFDREKKIFYRYLPNAKIRESLTIKAILDDENGHLWIGTRNGLYLFNKKTHEFTRYAYDPHNPFSLSQNNVQAIFKDAKGDFWFGTKRGINIINTSMPFVHYRADVYNKKCLNQEVVHTIIEDSRGNLWFGTEEGGLNRLDRKTGLFTYYVHDPNDSGSISSNCVTAIAEDEDGNFWIGTFQGGLNFLNRKENRFLHYKHDSSDPNSIYLNSISAILIDSDGDIWLGSSELHIFNRKEKKFIRFPINIIGPVTWDIRSIIQSKDGKIWVGGYDNRIYCIDKKTSEYESFYLPNISEDNRVNTIIEDKNGNLWIGSFRGGLYFFDVKQKTFQVYTKKDGLPSNNVGGILEDDLGNLWMGTTKGLTRFNKKEKTFKTYYKENGLQSNLFTNACYKTRSGEMFFGGINGVTAFYPDRILANTFIPPVVITDFKIFNKSVSIGGENPILTKSICETEAIKLSYKHSSFSFTFAALDFAISEQNQYAYMMEGFDTDWNYVGTRRYATYTNLNPGEYTFRVKAANHDGLWNEKGASIKITITPPFWETWWFKLIIISIVLLTIRHFMNYQAQKRNLLKTKALAHLTQLKLLRNQMNPHFLLNTLSSIRALVLIDKEQAWQMISELSEFFRYALQNFNKVEASLNDEIEAAQNYICIQKICFHDTLNVSYHLDDRARECTVPAFLLQPLIENAIKHGALTSSEQFKIIVRTLFEKGILSISVSNTGSLNSSTNNNAPKDNVHGTSLKNIKERLEIMFKDHFTFKLYEENGWVHVNIRINYEEKSNKKIFHKNKGALVQEKEIPEPTQTV